MFHFRTFQNHENNRSFLIVLGLPKCLSFPRVTISEPAFGRQGKPAQPLVVQRRWGWILWGSLHVRFITLGTLGCGGGYCFDWHGYRNSDQTIALYIVIVKFFVCHCRWCSMQRILFQLAGGNEIVSSDR